MDKQMKDFIDGIKEKAMNDKDLTRDELLKLFGLDPHSEECRYLGESARDVSRVKAKNKAKVGSSIGVDLHKCPINCTFCSLGEEWALFDEEYKVTIEEILQIIRDVIGKGFYQFTMRTTEFFPVDELCDIAKKIKAEFGQSVILNANTGELTLEEAKRLKEAGYTSAYHSLRLGEGKDTSIDPEVRKDTMRAIKEAGLRHACGLDPIGVEHTDEELADMLLFYRSISPGAICAMKRIAVKGTPKGELPEVSDIRIAQIAAVIRMASGGRNIVSVHPPIMQALQWGANNIAIECGANPRRNRSDMAKWEIFGHDEAIKFLETAGYDYGAIADFFNVKPN
jgi:Biotin synthase and related enzymes